MAALGPFAPTLPETPIVYRLLLSLALLIASEANSIYLGSSLFKTLASLSFFFGGLGQAFGKSTTDDVRTIWPMIKDFLDGKLQDNPYAFCMLIGLAFSVLGDVFLIPSREAYYGITNALGEKLKAEEPVKEEEKTPSKGKKKAGKRPAVVAAAPAATTVGPTTAPTPPASGDATNFKVGIACFALAQVAYAFGFISAPNATDIRYLEVGASIALCLIISRVLGLTGLSKKPWSWQLAVPKDMAPFVKIYICIIATMVAIASGTDGGLQKTVGAWMFLISDMFVAVDVFGRKPAFKGIGKQWEGRPGWKFRSVGWLFYFFAQIILAGCI